MGSRSRSIGFALVAPTGVRAAPRSPANLDGRVLSVESGSTQSMRTKPSGIAILTVSPLPMRRFMGMTSWRGWAALSGSRCFRVVEESAWVNAGGSRFVARRDADPESRGR